MNKASILEQLEYLQKDIANYANYLEEYTYHPYNKIEYFANELKDIINEIKNN